MNGLPHGWVETRLGALCSPPQYGWTTSAKKGGNGSLRFLRTTDITRGPVDWDTVPYCTDEPVDPTLYALAPGDILISRAGSVGFSCRLVDVRPSVFASYLIRFRPCQGLDGRYIAYFLQSEAYWRQVKTATSGITLANINAKNLAAITLPLAPRREQERIVAAIEEQFSRLDAGVAALESAREKLKRMRTAVLQAASTGQLVQHCASEDVDETLKVIETERQAIWARQMSKPYKPPAAPAQFALTLPKHWRLASLEGLTDPVRVICYGILMPKENIVDGVPYVRVKDMRRWSINLAGLKRTSRAIADKYARASLVKDDLLLAIRGSYGRAARVPDALEGGNITQDTARIAAHPLLDRRYLLYYLGGSVANRYYDRVARGVAVKGVNIGDLRTMPVPVPPRIEQAAIADEVERQFTVLDAMEAANAEQLRRAASLRLSILVAAFSGRLLPQSPDDEPASALLDRLAAAHSAADGRVRPERRRSRSLRKKVSA